MHFVQAKGILSSGNSMNIYRGCTHGCIYCDARSTCYQFDHSFEDVAVKRNAPELLEQALRRKRTPCMIATGYISDPYLPYETELALTRQCLSVIARYGFGLAIQTKSDRILRDLDLLRQSHRRAKCVVQMTLTTHDEDLCRILEPHVCTTARRLEVLRRLHAEGIPTVVWLSPLLPRINDTEENLRGILDGCIQAGVRGILCFNIGVTLRSGDREYYYRKMDEHFPSLRPWYERRYGEAYQVVSDNNARLMPLFHQICEEHGILHDPEAIFSYLREFESNLSGQQLTMF